MPARRTVLNASAVTLLAGMGIGAASRAQARAPVPLQITTPTSLPQEVAADLPGARSSGTARLRYFGFDVYDAALWVASGFSASRYAQYALALELTYLRSLKGNSIAERSLQEMRRDADLPTLQSQAWLSAMQSAFPDVRAGDRITGLHQPGIGARFWFNSQLRASVRDPEFSRLFFGIWLAETTSEPGLRMALLAGAAP